MTTRAKKDVDKLRKGRSTSSPKQYAQEKEAACPRAARVARPPRGVPDQRQADGLRPDEDHLWADALEYQRRRSSPTTSSEEAPARSSKKTFEADIGDTEAYIEDAIQRIHDVWDLFQGMKPKGTSSTTSSLFRELKDPLRLALRLRRVLPRRHGRGVRSATCSRRSTSTPSASSLEEIIKTAKGQKQSRAVKRLKVVSAFIPLPSAQQARARWCSRPSR